ncbi:MAG: UDP-2,4-diacetamido-2,4,6-trideoxy-beta-L-altropyranose hydrolase [Planctomycetota bacterium]|jgi:UDP-2,4-diacetamido-2,4,6-trideoxy-beta-L-altropyranose hydrolase
MIVAFRADASLAIGSGHVMRCLTVADALAARGHTAVFVSRAGDGDRLETVLSRGHGVERLSAPLDPEGAYREGEARPAHASWLGVHWEDDAAETRALVERTGADLLVLDHYALDARWEARACPDGVRRMVIDDLADRPHEADLLLDQNLGRTDADYADLVPASCRLCVGPSFAMVAPRFAELRPESLRRRVADPTVRKILISMGGVDAGNATGVCLTALEASSLPSSVEVTVVMGGRAPHLEAVRNQCAELRLATEVVVDVTDMPERMAAADLSLGGAGGTAWERCVVGLPTILLVLAPNQESGARALERAGAARLIAGPAELPEALAALTPPTALAELSRRAAAVLDGDGLDRLCTAIECLVPTRGV